MPNHVLCFALCRAIPISKCSEFTNIPISQISENIKNTGYYHGCAQCELVKHGSNLESYPKESHILTTLNRQSEILDELYRSSNENYFIACPQCYTVYRVFMAMYPEEVQEQTACCPKCSAVLSQAGSCDFIEESL